MEDLALFTGIAGVIVGIVLSILVLSNNPKLRDRLFKMKEDLEKQIEDQIDRDI